MPDLYRVIISPRASADLEEIYEYIVKDSPQNAGEVVDRLLAAIDALEMLPYRYNVAPVGKRRPSRDARLMPVPPFRIYYRVVEDERVVRIVAVERGSRGGRRRRRGGPM